MAAALELNQFSRQISDALFKRFPDWRHYGRVEENENRNEGGILYVEIPAPPESNLTNEGGREGSSPLLASKRFLLGIPFNTILAARRHPTLGPIAPLNPRFTPPVSAADLSHHAIEDLSTGPVFDA
jgi:hypothetical protein